MQYQHRDDRREEGRHQAEECRAAGTQPIQSNEKQRVGNADPDRAADEDQQEVVQWNRKVSQRLDYDRSHQQERECDAILEEILREWRHDTYGSLKQDDADGEEKSRQQRKDFSHLCPRLHLYLVQSRNTRA